MPRKETSLDLGRLIESKLESDPDLRKSYQQERRHLSIGRQLAALRRQLGWTQSETARRAGMQRPNLARLERPVYASYTVQTLERVAAALGQRLRISMINDDGIETVLIDEMIHPSNLSEEDDTNNP